MIYRLSDPVTEPVSLAEAKAHLRVDVPDDDALITAIISAARDSAEMYCNRPWAAASFVETFDSLVGTEIQLTATGVTAVSKVEYLDAAGAAQSVTTGITLDALSGLVTLASAVSGTRVKVYYSAGSATVPASIKQALLLKIGDMYENRAAQQWQALYVNQATSSLMYPYRVRIGV